MVKRRTVVLVVLAALVAVAAGCGSSSGTSSEGGSTPASSSSGPVKLTMWWWGDQEAAGMKNFVADSVPEVRGRPPEHHDRHGAAVDRQPDAELRRGGEGQAGAGHRVPLGRHLEPAGRLGRQPRRGVRLHPPGRALPLPEHIRGHVGRQGVDGAVVRPALVPGAVPQGHPPGCRRRGADQLGRVPGGLRHAECEGHHADRRRRQGRLVRRMALLDHGQPVPDARSRTSSRRWSATRSSPTPSSPSGGRSCRR